MLSHVTVHSAESDLDAAVALAVVEHLRAGVAGNGSATFIGSAGRTPTGIYALLRSHFRHALDWSRVRVVQMDEYLGVPPASALSLASYLRHQVVEPLGITDFVTLNNASGGLAHPLPAYDSMARGADVVLHGVGRNGHLGFNEPPSAPDAATRVVDLARDTLRDNAVPLTDPRGVTLGLDCLLTARHSIVVAKGSAKADAAAAMVAPVASAECPASWVRLSSWEAHLDAEAATRIGAPIG